jgi:hypothetical protein
LENINLFKGIRNGFKEFGEVLVSSENLFIKLLRNNFRTLQDTVYTESLKKIIENKLKNGKE